MHRVWQGDAGYARRVPPDMPVSATVQRGPFLPRGHRRGRCVGVLRAFALGDVCVRVSPLCCVRGAAPGEKRGTEAPRREGGWACAGRRAMRAPSLARARPLIQRGSLFLCVPHAGGVNGEAGHAGRGRAHTPRADRLHWRRHGGRAAQLCRCAGARSGYALRFLGVAPACVLFENTF